MQIVATAIRTPQILNIGLALARTDFVCVSNGSTAIAETERIAQTPNMSRFKGCSCEGIARMRIAYIAAVEAYVREKAKAPATSGGGVGYRTERRRDV